MAAAKRTEPVEPPKKPRKAHKPREILTAEQWQARLAADERAARKAEKENRHEEKRRNYQLSVLDLRDQTVSIVRNTYGDDYEKCYRNGGAHPSTIKAWQQDKVHAPQMPTVRATLWACGFDFTIQPRQTSKVVPIKRRGH